MKLFPGTREDYRKNLPCMQEVTDRLLSHMKGTDALKQPCNRALAIRPEILVRMRDRFRELKESGTFDHGDWAVWL